MAWTIVETVEVWKMKHEAGDEMIRVKLVCTSDATGTDYDIVTDLVRGTWLYMLKTVPVTGDDAPSGTFDLDVEDEDNLHILDTNANSNTAPSASAGDTTLKIFPPVLEKCSVVIATLGTGKKATIYLYFVK